MLVRTVVGIIIAVVLLAALANQYVFVVVFALAFLLAIDEMHRMFKGKGLKVFMIPSYIFAGSFGPLYLLTKEFGDAGMATALLFAYSMLLFVSTIIGQVFYCKNDCTPAIFSLVPLIYPLLSACALVFMYFGLKERVIGITATAVAILAPLASDVLAYFGGVLFGKHPLCPNISPKKTVEGSIFGVIGGMLMGMLLYFLQGFWGASTDWHTMLVIGLLCGVAGQFGDLYASSIKRWAGIKDFSSLLPGHGGILDRLDSTWVCAPIVLCYLLLMGY
ncbi:MAG: CDP-archaeol synthase [Eubacteriales bacterium]|nr:CDP-archaeol synthase [Eubacteriales bacterium]